MLDPTLVAALRRLRLDEIEAPIVPSKTVIELLADAAPIGHRNGSTASDVAAAITAASRTEDLLRLFAEIAVATIDVTDVAFIRLTRTSAGESHWLALTTAAFRPCPRSACWSSPSSRQWPSSEPASPFCEPPTSPT